MQENKAFATSDLSRHLHLPSQEATIISSTATSYLSFLSAMPMHTIISIVILTSNNDTIIQISANSFDINALNIQKVTWW